MSDKADMWVQTPETEIAVLEQQIEDAEDRLDGLRAKLLDLEAKLASG